jgi:hypothetical protein
MDNYKEVIGIMIVLTIVVIIFMKVGSLLILALIEGLDIICSHGEFRVPKDLFLDESQWLNYFPS